MIKRSCIYIFGSEPILNFQQIIGSEDPKNIYTQDSSVIRGEYCDFRDRRKLSRAYIITYRKYRGRSPR